ADSVTVRGFTLAAGSDGSALLAPAGVSAVVTNTVVCDSETAVELAQDSNVALVNNTLYGNVTGVQIAEGAYVSDFRNNAVAMNGAAFGGSLAGLVGGGYNCFHPGDLSSLPFSSDFFAPDPAFMDADGGNFHLCSYSPCRDSGDDGPGFADRDGSRNDIGADGGPQGVEDTLVPEVVLTADGTQGEAPLLVTFDASSSTDEWGIAQASWDFDDRDGIQDESAGLVSSCTYTAPGSYVATVTVTDHNGMSASSTVSITVGSDPPSLAVTRTPMAGPAPLEVAFESEAVDPDGGSVSVEWDFDGDGLADSTELAPQVVFDAETVPGAYFVQVSATDDEGQVASERVPFTVTYGTPKAAEEVDPSQNAHLEVAAPDSILSGATFHVPQGALSESHVVTLGELPGTFPLPSKRTAALVEVGPVELPLSQYARITVPALNPWGWRWARVIRYESS
ncbi:MAG: PKD domain-containing protein, partial [bacterium]|nr:PKD domain-containing protein [bacterium]